MAKESKHPVEKYFHKVTKYHIFFFALLFLTKVPIFWHVLSLLFTTPPMTYTCEGSTEINPCPCKKPIWNYAVFTKTVQTKYNIYCETKWLVSFTQSMLYVGTLIGAFSFGVISDKFGRLTAYLMSSTTLGVAGCLVAVMPSAITFIIVRCIEGIGVGGAIVTSYVLLIEYCGVNYREVMTALYHLPLNISHMSLAGVSYLIRDSDTFQLAISVPVFFTLLLYFLINESPKWLLDNNKVDKAALIMEKVAKFNKAPAGSIKSDLQRYASQQTALKLERVSFWHIFRYKRLTINLLCMAFIYFTCGMGYYGVSQYIGQMSGDIHSNVAMSGGLLIPGTCIAAYALYRFGRRSFLMTTCFISGVLMIVVILIPENAHLVRVLVACIGCSVFFMSFITVFLYGVELFPTTIRNSVLGFLSLMSRAGQIAAPPINSLPPMISGATFGTLAIVGGFLCMFLPETKNTELPSTLEETTNLARR